MRLASAGAAGWVLLFGIILDLRLWSRKLPTTDFCVPIIANTTRSLSLLGILWFLVVGLALAMLKVKHVSSFCYRLDVSGTPASRMGTVKFRSGSHSNRTRTIKGLAVVLHCGFCKFNFCGLYFRGSPICSVS